MATVGTRTRHWSARAAGFGVIVRLGVLVVGLFVSLSSWAADVPQSFTLDGRLYSNAASTTPLVDSAITFKVQILDEDRICILYEETQSISTLASSGYFSVSVGPWVTSTVVNPGETVRARVYTSSNVSDVHSVVVTIGSTVGTTWTVTNKAGNTRIFVTSGSYNGNLGGLTGADANCQANANAAGYGGVWKAILSDSKSDAKDRLIITYPAVRASDGVTVAMTNLFSGSWTNALSPGPVWTGSGSNGLKDNQYYDSPPAWCSDWSNSSSSESVAYGYPNDVNAWGFAGYSACPTAFKLICIEQPDPGCTPGGGLGFTNVTGATRSSLVTSNTVTPTGCGTSSFVIVHGEGSPQISINGGAWVTNGTLNVGDTLAVRATAHAGYNQTSTVRVSIGGTIATWTIGTESSGAATKIFATQGRFNGNLGGLTGADALCQGEATTRGYGGTWKALLSNSSTNAKDRLSITYPVIRAIDGVVVAAANLWSGSIAVPVNLYGTGGVWSGSGTAGSKVGVNWCDDWTNGSGGYGSEQVGISRGVDYAWISYSGYPCDANFRLICVSQ